MFRHTKTLGSLLALLVPLHGCASAEPSFSTQSNEDALLAATRDGAAAQGRGSPGGKNDDALGGDAPAQGALDGGVAGLVLCGNAPCECNNGVDDDGDGNADGADIECTGALDDEEKSFGTGIPGDNKDPKWQDCFFDGNSGHGDDRCRYPTTCLTGELSQDDPACAITQACLDECFPSTPAGCDCFGCCTVPFGEGSVNIRLTDTCTADTLGDADACPVCTPSVECNGDNPPAEAPDAGAPEDPATPEDPGTPEDPETPDDPGTDPTDPPIIR
jgi:hypothetical protein